MANNAFGHSAILIKYEQFNASMPALPYNNSQIVIVALADLHLTICIRLVWCSSVLTASLNARLFELRLIYISHLRI
jgi:hypothetical protein